MVGVTPATNNDEAREDEAFLSKSPQLSSWCTRWVHGLLPGFCLLLRNLIQRFSLGSTGSRVRKVKQGAELL